MMKSWEASRYRERYAIGLDFGQQVDYSALAVVSQHATQGAWDPHTETYHPDWHLQVKWLERPLLGTTFASVVRRAVALRAALVTPGEPSLRRRDEFPEIVIDSTGVGAPLREMFQQQHKVQPVPVVITGGREANVGASGVRVPKQDLIAALSIEFELQRIKIASGLDLADDLLGELRNFRMETNSATGRTKFDAAPGHHDDLLIAVSLAVWRLHHARVQGGTGRVRGI